MQKHYPPEIIATIGIGIGAQQGAFRGNCSHDFTNGRSWGWLVGISYSSPLAADWLWGTSVLLTKARVQASYRERELATFAAPTDTFRMPVDTRSRAELNLSTALLWAYLRWRPTVWLLLSAGPTLNLPLSAPFRHKKELAQESITLPTGEVVLIQIDNSPVVESAQLPTRFQWGGILHIGADLFVAREWWLSFGLYSLLHGSAALRSPSTFRLLQWYCTLSLGRTW
ncbi:MAG: hypothetical protein NZ949_06590 [Candidatus Kapabacteria bacterium]|nr:hypothetical protein [Candidatus Kapabacteria bacterium]MDW7996246.1 hypothetical protein [Bacteroidota bacterium]